MVKTRLEIIFLFCLLILSALLRVPQLGYSHFYGDEIKTLYLDKTQPASEFFLSQRKGPMQFLVVWVVEKVQGFDEMWIRLPFAIAGVGSVLVLYLLSKELFGRKAGAISSLFYSVSGFSIAFSRTAQYQSFLILFSLISIYLFILACEKKKPIFFVLSAVLFGISFLFHYDSIFYLVPMIVVAMKHIKKDRYLIRFIILDFILPVLTICALFYIPYFVKGYFQSEALGYLRRRLSGKEYLQNNSLYTFFVYNPSVLAFIPFLSTAIYLLFSKKYFHQVLFLAWFLVPYIIFQGIIRNPGTHILNYFIPAYIYSGAGFVLLARRFKRIYIISAVVVLYLGILSAGIYLPFLNRGYPWISTIFPLANMRRADKFYNLFLYGFPYNRGWDQIRQFFLSQSDASGVNGVYTNDNETIAQYYLLEFYYTRPGLNFIPQYYINVLNNQETASTPSEILSVLDTEYIQVKEIVVNGKTSALIYRKKTI